MTIVITEIVDRGPTGRWVGTWKPEYDAALRRHIGAGLSRSQAATAINEEFDTKFGRNATIGRCYRLGIETVKMAKKTPVTRTPRQRPIRTARQTFRPQPALPPDQTELRFAVCEPLRISILELTEHTCKWPLGEVADLPPFQFCGCPVLEGTPYCAAHFRISSRVGD